MKPMKLSELFGNAIVTAKQSGTSFLPLDQVLEQIQELEAKAAFFDKMSAFPQHVHISTHAPFDREGVAWHINDDCHSFSINADTLAAALEQIPESRAGSTNMQPGHQRRSPFLGYSRPGRDEDNTAQEEYERAVREGLRG